MTKKRRTPDTTEPQTPLWKALLLGLIAINGLALLSILIAWLSTTLALIVGVLGGLVILIAGSTLWGWELLMAGILAVVSAAAGVMFRDYQVARTGQRVHGIPVNQAADYPQASIFYFTDGYVSLQHTGVHHVRTYEKGSGSYSNHYYFAAPILPEDWQPGDPVPLWAVCDQDISINPCYQDWATPLRAGLVENSFSSISYREAVAETEATYNLVSRPGAPLLHWTDEPEKEIEAQHGRPARGLWILTNSLYVLGVLGARIYKQISR